MIVATETTWHKTLEFRSAADVLRWLAENRSQGTYRSKVQHWYLSRPEDHGAYWLERDNRLKLSKEDYARVYRLLKRYQGFCRHMEEIDPDWQDGEKTYWADNSVDVLQHSRTYPGVTRTVQLVGPHGDACF